MAEASGVAASRQFQGRLYHINDSGDGGNFYITDMNGSNVEVVGINGFKPRDTEALALGPCPGTQRTSCLYIGDIGDNDRQRKSLEIIVLEEKRDFSRAEAARNRLRLRYPDGPHDAEAMAVDPSGAIYILTKERPPRLFKAESAPADQTLRPVTALDMDAVPTDMAISDDGTRLLVITYSDATEFSMDFKQRQRITLTYLQQQEAATYLPGSRSFIYTTEQLLRALPQWIMKVDCK